MRVAKRHLVTNAVANWIGFGAQVAVTFVLAPILVRGLGDERYGIWSLVASVLAYLTLFDLGVGASVVRYVARFEATRDDANLNRVFSTSVCIFAAAGSAAFALAVGVAWLGTGALGVPPEFTGEARGALVLLGLNLALGLPLGVFPAVLDGLGRFPPKVVIRTAGMVVRVPVFLAVLRAGGGLIGLAWALTVCNLLENLALAAAARHYLPALRFSPRQADRTTFGMVWGYSVGAFVAMLAGRISFQTDALVIGAFLTTASITFFTLGASLVENAKSSIRAATIVLTPAVSALEAVGDLAAIRRVLLDTTRYVLWLVLPIQVGLFLLGKPFLALWIDPEHAAASYPVMAILALPLALTLSQSVSGRILYGTGRLRWFAGAALAEALANLLLSVALVKPLGIEGVAWGTAIPNVLFNLAVAVYICRTLDVPLVTYARRSFLEPVAVAALLAAGWLAAAAWWGAPASWVAWLTTGAVGTSGYLLVAAFVEFGPRTVLGCLRRAGERCVALLAPVTVPLPVTTRDEEPR